MHTMTIAQTIPAHKLSHRVLEVDGYLFRIVAVRHRHVGGCLTTQLGVEPVPVDKYDAHDGHNWRSITITSQDDD
jgi:hypothetical protein